MMNERMLPTSDKTNWVAICIQMLSGAHYFGVKRNYWRLSVAR